MHVSFVATLDAQVRTLPKDTSIRTLNTPTDFSHERNPKPAIHKLKIDFLFPDSNAETQMVDLQNYFKYKIQIVNPINNDTIYPNETFSFVLTTENNGLLIFSNCIVVDKIYPNDTLIIGFDKFLKYNKLHIGDNYNICVPKKSNPIKQNLNSSNSISEFQTVELIDGLVSQSKNDRDSTQSILFNRPLEIVVKVRFESQQSLMIDFFSYACEVPDLEIGQTTNNQLNFTVCDKSLGFLYWEITNKNGKIIARGQLDKTSARQSFLIYVDGLKTGSYTLTTGLKSNAVSKNFFIL
jgi:hypothetical protein